MEWFLELEKRCKKINREYSPELTIRLITEKTVDRRSNEVELLLKSIVIEFNSRQTEVVTKGFFKKVISELEDPYYIDIARVVSNCEQFNIGLIVIELIEKDVRKIEPYSHTIEEIINKVVSLVCIQRR